MAPQAFVQCDICGFNMSTDENDFLITHKLRDDEHICWNCLSRIRVLYPTKYVFEDGKYKIVNTYREHSAKELKESFDKAHEYREELIQKYGYHHGAFEVAAAQNYKGGFLQPDCFNIFGRTLYGSIQVYDEVEIHHGGNVTKAVVDYVYHDSYSIPFHGLSMKDLKWNSNHNLVDTAIGEGKVGIMIFKGKIFDVCPGDIILN